MGGHANFECNKLIKFTIHYILFTNILIQLNERETSSKSLILVQNHEKRTFMGHPGDFFAVYDTIIVIDMKMSNGYVSS